MSRLHQPFMSPSPWGIPSRRAPSEPQNAYSDMNYFGDDIEWPNGRLMDESLHPWWHEHGYWLTAGEKTEMTAEWLKVVNATQGGIVMNLSTAGGGTGYHIVKDGRYDPYFHSTGQCVNNDDWSLKYDGMRGVVWDYWTATNPSDQHNYEIGRTPTAGSVNFGTLLFSVSRAKSYYWRVDVTNGDGGSDIDNFIAGSVNISGDSSALQFEFVKGSHITLKMYANVNASLNFSGFSMPTWPIAESGNYVTVPLSGAGYSRIVPISPSVSSASSVEASNGRIGRYAYELRAIGHDWENLV